MTEDGTRFKNKKAALREVSSAMASLMDAGSEADLFGYDLDLTGAQRERMAWAMDEVARRLYKMGGG